LVRVVWLTFVSWLTAVTVAFTTTAPVGSVTAPLRDAVFVCAIRAPPSRANVVRTKRQRLMRFALELSRCCRTKLAENFMTDLLVIADVQSVTLAVLWNQIANSARLQSVSPMDVGEQYRILAAAENAARTEF
jgi:hypothetical protein